MEQARHGRCKHQELSAIEQQADAARQRGHQALGSADGGRGQREAEAHQQRPQRERSPVDQKTLAKRTRPPNPPDGIERTVHRHHERQRCGDQQAEAHGAKSAGLVRELHEQPQHRPGDAVGHQGAEELTLQRVLQVREHGESREDRQGHRHERHERDERGEREAARREAQPVLAKAFGQRPESFRPGPVAQRVHEALQALGGTRSVRGCRGVVGPLHGRSGGRRHAGYDAA
jgi:hypothetical protein